MEKLKRAIREIFCDKTPVDIHMWTGIPIERCAEIATVFVNECFIDDILRDNQLKL